MLILEVIFAHSDGSAVKGLVRLAHAEGWIGKGRRGVEFVLIGGAVENVVVELELVGDWHELWCSWGQVYSRVTDSLEIGLIHLLCAFLFLFWLRIFCNCSVEYCYVIHFFDFLIALLE